MCLYSLYKSVSSEFTLQIKARDGYADPRDAHDEVLV